MCGWRETDTDTDTDADTDTDMDTYTAPGPPTRRGLPPKRVHLHLHDYVLCTWSAHARSPKPFVPRSARPAAKAPKEAAEAKEAIES